MMLVHAYARVHTRSHAQRPVARAVGEGPSPGSLVLDSVSVSTARSGRGACKEASEGFLQREGLASALLSFVLCGQRALRAGEG